VLEVEMIQFDCVQIHRFKKLNGVGRGAANDTAAQSHPVSCYVLA
jgi:hypothetical protein